LKEEETGYPDRELRPGRFGWDGLVGYIEEDIGKTDCSLDMIGVVENRLFERVEGGVRR
jgi:hypothetical protein